MPVAVSYSAVPYVPICEQEGLAVARIARDVVVEMTLLRDDNAVNFDRNLKT